MLDVPPDPDLAARRLGLDLGLTGILTAACLAAAHALNKLIPDVLSTRTKGIKGSEPFITP